MSDTVVFNCECNSFCGSNVELSIEEALRIKSNGWVVLSNKCSHGAEPTDRLVERHETYSIYEETE